MKLAAMIASVTLWGITSPAHAGDTPEGKRVFMQDAQPSCTICHTLADAGASGAIGPNLDDLKPSREQIINAVTSGVGVMPAFGDSLTKEQIEAVADYIASVTGVTD
ncbi:MAG: cytochrome c [Gammaproteobacteria bacterium]|uniref:Cytochrome c6 n=1 Tax=Marinobacter litoralis TaxID=187981 RepID=A0A3M2RHV8_9GAMM|nr:cytochrome c [Marinobacter litoralis]MBR9871498.1 cytochrome c [Gammaproteobacteria bacterium]RMJ04495.1 Cytochrome c6 [Marinobacter litoralis]